MKKLFVFVLISLPFVMKAQSQYNEDVSAFRPVYSATDNSEQKVQESEVVQEDSIAIENHKNTQVDAMTNIINTYYTKADNEIRGYRIQIYSGPTEGSANDLRQRFLNKYGNKYSVYKEYKTPDFKVMAGDFVDRLESFRLYHDVVKDFKKSLLIPYKVKFHKLK